MGNMKLIKKMLTVLPIVLCLASCTEVYRYTNNSFFAMNTVVDVIRNADIKGDYTLKTVSDIENLMSRTIQDSEIFKVNSGEEIVLSGNTLYVLEKSLEIAKATDYAFNPCMGTLTDLWDITSGRNYVPSQMEIDEALSFCDASLVSIVDGAVVKPQGMKIDLGGATKGYALEKSCESMKACADESKVSPDFCISLGGNIGVCGSSEAMKKEKGEGWRVGIADPFVGETTMGSLVMTHGFIAVSGAYERYFEKDGVIYHHIFDPKTGRPADSGLASVAIVCDDGLVGDALSTALFVMGEERALEFYRKGLYDFDMIVATLDGRVLVTKGVLKDFTLNGNAKNKENNKLKLEIIN